MNQENLTLDGLAASISQLTAALTSGLKAANSPEPSFAADAPSQLPPSPAIQGPRLQLVEALMNMLHLALGPTDYFLQLGFGLNNEATALRMLHRYDIWNKVPLEGSASYADIAAATKLPESIVRRFLRVAMNMHLFREESLGSDRIVHTAASAHVVRQPVFDSFVGHCMEDISPAAVRGIDALDQYFVGHTEASEETDHAPAALAYAGTTLWEFMANDESHGKPKGYRATRLAEAMQAISSSSAVATEEAVNVYDWDSLGDATVVDVGGSSGHISLVLAKQHPKLNFVVQDLPEAETAFKELVSTSDLKSRVSFRAHDFFKPQTEPADAFFIKSVFHDWPDKYVIQILKNITPVLKSGTRVLLCDIVIPPDYDPSGKPTVPLSLRKFFGVVDLQMFTAFNSKERKVEEWVSCFKRADGRFELGGVHISPGSPLAILEFIFQG